MGQLLWYLAAAAATPTLLAGAFWFARADMPRTIAVLALLALGLGVAGALIYAVELKTLGVGGGYFPGPGGPVLDVQVAWLQTLFTVHDIALTVIESLQGAAWTLALYHAVQARRGRWLALLVVCAGLSSVAVFFATQTFSIGYLTVVPMFAYLLALHPYLSLFLANVLPFLAAAATLLYVQFGLRVRGSSGLVPGANVSPTDVVPAFSAVAPTSPRFAVGIADGDQEDDEFAIEELPRGRR